MIKKMKTITVSYYYIVKYHSPSFVSLNMTTPAGGNMIGAYTLATTAASGGKNLSNCTHTHTHVFNGPLSGTTQVSQYHKGKTNIDFIGARDSE